MNWSNIIAGVEKAAEFVQSPEIAEIAGLGGPHAEAVVKMVQGAAAVVGAVAHQAQGTIDVLSTDDLLRIRAAQDAIMAANNALSQQVNQT